MSMTAASRAEQIAAGRTDLVFPHVDGGGAVDSAAGGATLLQWCAYYGDVSAMRFLLSSGAAIGTLGANLDLNGAAFHGHWRLCAFLIEQGANPNFPLPDTGETPLHAALCARESMAHERCVDVLLAAGADPNRATNPGAATGAFMRDARTRGETPLHRAASLGTARAITLLIDAGARLDARDAAGDTPLSWASWALRDPAILRLLCYGPHRISADYAGMSSNLLGSPKA